MNKKIQILITLLTGLYFFSCASNPESNASVTTSGPPWRPDPTTSTETTTTTASTTESTTTTSGSDTTTSGSDTTTAQSSIYPPVTELTGPELKANYDELKGEYPRVITYYMEKYGFSDSTVTENISNTEKNNLLYYIENVAPIISKKVDIQLYAWWLLNKKIFQSDPYKLNKCDSVYLAADVDCPTTDTNGWIVGYNVKVLNFLDEKLYTAFKTFYGEANVSTVMTQVLTKTGLSMTPNFTDLSIEDFIKDSNSNFSVKDGSVSKIEQPEKSKAGRSMRFWISLLLRDPKIGAQLSSVLINEFNCFGKLSGDSSIPAAWCANEESITEDKKSIYSDQMKRLINTWNAIKPSLVNRYN